MAEQSVLARFENLKKKQEALIRQAANLEGQRDQLFSRLQAEFQISDIEEAKKKLESMEKDLKKRQIRADKLLTELEEVVYAAGNND